MDEKNEIGFVGDVEPKQNPNRVRRRYFSLEQRMQMMKLVKRYVSLDYSYDDMQQALMKEGFKVSVGTLFKFVLQAKEALISAEEANRIMLNLAEQRRRIRSEMFRIFREMQKERQWFNAAYQKWRDKVDAFERENPSTPLPVEILRERPKEKYTLKDDALIVKSVEESQKNHEDFVSRFNLIPPIPTRTEFAQATIDVDELLNRLNNTDDPIPKDERPIVKAGANQISSNTR